MARLTEEYLAGVKRGDVLALDCATTTGFYSVWDYGSWRFPDTDRASKKLGPDYEQHKCFRETIMAFIQAHGIKVVAAEDVNVGGKFMALRKLSQLQGVLFELCATMGVPLVLFNVTSIKRWATGDGKADKAKMMEAAARRWKIDPERDDNAADAAHIFFYFCERYGL